MAVNTPDSDYLDVDGASPAPLSDTYTRHEGRIGPCPVVALVYSNGTRLYRLGEEASDSSNPFRIHGPALTFTDTQFAMLEHWVSEMRKAELPEQRG